MKITLKILMFMIIFCSIMCNECDDNCLECNKQVCIQCKSKFIIYNNICFKECPLGTYKDEKWETCRKCDSNCPVCWGPNYDNCGLSKGISSKIVFIENEILTDISNIKYTEKDTNQWIIKLKLILKNREKYTLGNYNSDNIKFQIFDNSNSYNNILDQNIINPNIKNIRLQSMKTNTRKKDNFTENNSNLIVNLESNPIFNALKLKENSEILLSQNEVYSTNGFAITLPLGSFSKFNGVFIPIPSYLFKNIIVKTHWIFVKGQFSNNSWNTSWNPVISEYLKTLGNKSKIYYENQGFWVFSNETWTWIKDKKSLVNNEYSKEDVDLILSNLNSNSFGNIDSLIRYKFENEKVIKQENLRQNVNTLINNLKYSSNKVLEKIKEKINREKTIVDNSLSELKNEIKDYLIEEETLMNSYK